MNRTIRKTSSYLLSVSTPDADRNAVADQMKAACPVPVDTCGIGDGQAFLRYRASSDDEAVRTAYTIVLSMPGFTRYSLSTGYGAHFRPVAVA